MLGGVLVTAEIPEQQCRDELTVELLGEHLALRNRHRDSAGNHVVGQGRTVRTKHSEDVTERTGGVEAHLEEHVGHLVQAVLEARHDAEVATASAQSPHEIAVLGVARSHDAAVGEHHFGGDEVVAGQPVLAGQPSDAAVERETGDAGHGDEAQRGRETVLLGGGVELAEQHPRLHAGDPPIGIDVDVLHERQIDDDPALAH